MLIPLPDERVEILGASWFEPTERGLLPHRLPAWTRTQWPDVGYGQNVTQGSGVRLRFTTASDRVVLHVAVSRGSYRGPGPEDVPSEVGPPAVFDWIVDGDLVASTSPDEAGIITFDARDGSLTDCPGPPSTVSLDLPSASGEPRTVEVWLPYRERVRLIALEVGDVAPAPPLDLPRWVHHGSSISHGANAATPTGTWPVIAAHAAGLDLVNLGFSGAAVLDPFVARTMRNAPADVLSLKIGINVLNGDHYGRRMFAPLLHGFLDTVREGHPDTPLLVISPLLCPIAERVPGPTFIDPDVLPTVVFTSGGRPEQVAEGKLTLRAMREIVAEVVEARQCAGDENLHHLDGLELYGPEDWTSYPMADLLHPDPPAQGLIGERAAPVLASLLPAD